MNVLQFSLILFFLILGEYRYSEAQSTLKLEEFAWKLLYKGWLSCNKWPSTGIRN